MILNKTVTKIFFAFVGILFSTGCFAMENLETVGSVDLERYQGTWYEIARIPASFQKKCKSNTSAEYKLQLNGRVGVTNSCKQGDGKIKIAKGEAKVVDSFTNSKLKVTFVNFFGAWIYAFGGDYWVLDLDEDYRYVVIGHPKKTYAWILSRDRFVDFETLKKLTGVLASSGYDVCLLKTTVQDGGMTDEKRLCDVVDGPSNFSDSSANAY